MAVTLNASTSTGYIQTADTSGDLALQSNGTTQFNVTSTGAYGQVKASTAVTASGTEVSFTNIPSWVKRITVMINGLSTSSTGVAILQLGDSGGYETSGYAGATNVTSSAATTTSVLTTGIPLYGSFSAAQTLVGNITLTLVDSATNTWTATIAMARTDASSAGYGGYAKSLSTTLDRLRLYIDGTQTFDAGTINILYEG
jgi:hypothetical protein